MRRGRKKLLAVVLAAAMAMNMSTGVFASEVSENNSEEKTVSNNENTVYALGESTISDDDKSISEDAFISTSSDDVEAAGASRVNADNVAKAIKNYCDSYVGKDYPYNYAGKAAGCHGFVNGVWKNVYGYDTYENHSSRTGDQTNWGTFADYLYNNARPGDILRVYGGTPHSVVIYSIDSMGMRFYESTGNGSGSGQNKVLNTYNTYSAFRNHHSGCTGYFLYQMNDDIYQSVGGSANDTSAPTVSDLRSENVTKDGFDVSCTATDDVGVTRVQFYSWGVQGDGHPQEIVDAQYSNGRWRTHVNGANHSNYEGNYFTDAYAYDAAGNQSEKARIVTYVDRTAPVISDVKIENITDYTYDVSCAVADSSEVSDVNFLTWTEAGGRDDLVTRKGTYSNGRWTYRAYTSEHNNAGGNYCTVIQATDSMGNTSDECLAGKAYIDNQKPSISDIKAENLSADGVDISCAAADDTGVTSMKVFMCEKGGIVPIEMLNGSGGVLRDGRWIQHINFSDISSSATDFEYSISVRDANNNLCESEKMSLHIDKNASNASKASFQIADVHNDGFDLKCQKTDGSKITKVVFYSGKCKDDTSVISSDNVTFYHAEGTLKDGFWKCHMSTELLGEGTYAAYMIAYDSDGNSVQSDIQTVYCDQTKPEVETKYHMDEAESGYTVSANLSDEKSGLDTADIMTWTAADGEEKAHKTTISYNGDVSADFIYEVKTSDFGNQTGIYYTKITVSDKQGNTAFDVYCKIKVPKVAEQKWTLLQVHFGHNCKALYHDSMERCCA